MLQFSNTLDLYLLSQFPTTQMTMYKAIIFDCFSECWKCAKDFWHYGRIELSLVALQAIMLSVHMSPDRNLLINPSWCCVSVLRRSDYFEKRLRLSDMSDSFYENFEHIDSALMNSHAVDPEKITLCQSLRNTYTICIPKVCAHLIITACWTFHSRVIPALLL